MGGNTAPVAERSRTQERWDGFGDERMREIRANPGRFIIDDKTASRFYFAKRQAFPDIMRLLGDISGRKVLDMGCGRGELSIYLAKKGALVTGVDVGPKLVAGCRLLAKVNCAGCCAFAVASATDIPAEGGSFDFVVGLSILHHLSEADLMKAVAEAHRVLKGGGAALFHEPVENSPAFNLIQNVLPAGRKGDRYYRPSVLCRREWKGFREKSDNRVLTDREIIRAGKAFEGTRLRHYGLLVRLTRVLGEASGPAFERLDKALLSCFPPLKRFSQTALIEYRKGGAAEGRGR